MDLPAKLLLAIIEKAKENLKESEAYQDMCDELEEDHDVIDLVPVRFGEIDTSAVTESGVITLNLNILEKKDIFEVEHYLLHELKHALDQCQAPTQSANDGDYLSNPDEVAAFQHQLKHLDDEGDTDAAAEYVTQVLNHHEETGKERMKKRKKLLELVKEE